jgi:flagellar basal body-associated protein FliL
MSFAVTASFGFTGYQWWSSSRAADASEKQVQIAEAALAQQTEATKNALTLAKDSVAVAELALQVGNRAWVHVFEVATNDQICTGQRRY